MFSRFCVISSLILFVVDSLRHVPPPPPFVAGGAGIYKCSMSFVPAILQLYYILLPLRKVFGPVVKLALTLVNNLFVIGLVRVQAISFEGDHLSTTIIFR